MTARRRRRTHSLWLESLRLSSSGKVLRRSAQQTGARSRAGADYNAVRHVARDDSHSPNRTDFPPHPDPDESTNSHCCLHVSTHPNPSLSSSLPRDKDASSTLIAEENANDVACASFMPSQEIEDKESCFPDLDENKNSRDSEQQGFFSRDVENVHSEEESEPRPVFQPFQGAARELQRNSSLSDSEDTPRNHENVFSQHSILEFTASPTPITGGPDHNQGNPATESRTMGDSEANSNNPDARTLEEPLRRNLQIWNSDLNLTAMVAVVGSVRYTVQQYDYTRDLLRDAGADPTWPPYARTQRYFRRIVETCMPSSKLLRLPKGKLVTRSTPSDDEIGSDSQRGSPELGSNRTHRGEASVSSRTEKVRIFLPSSWAKLDVATSVVFDEMFPSYYDGQQTPAALEVSRIIRDRASIARSCDEIFVNHGGEQVRCSTGSVIEVSVLNELPSFGTSFDISDMGDSYLFQGTIVTTWCVGNRCCSNGTEQGASNAPSLSCKQQAIVKAFYNASAPETLRDDSVKGPIPGDLCTLLNSEHSAHRKEIYPVIVHRFWRFDDGIPSVMLLWVRLSQPPPDSPTEEENSVNVLETHVVEDVILIRGSNDSATLPEHGDSAKAGSESYGTLSDGTPFVIYRILLYCDDFQKSSSMYPQGSAGGCYFLPLSLPPDARRSTSSVRIISLTPPGVSTNQVLHYIVEDIVNSSINGIDGRTPRGEKVKIFTDVVAFVGDYPASSSVIDVAGHTCRAPCTLCSFRRLQDAGTEGSRFGFTTNVHASNSAFLRHGRRHQSLRESQISNLDANKIGMVSGEKYSDVNCPLIYLQRALQSKGRSALTSGGAPVVSSDFDAFRCNLVAPDHLLAGLSKDILNATFRALPAKELRSQLDTHICAALRNNGLLRQRQVFHDKKKLLHSMTLSEVFCVLLVSVPTTSIIIRQCASDLVIHDCFKLLQQIQRLIALTYWWPLLELDGGNSVTLVHGEKDSYFSDLKVMSKSYVEEVDKICRKSKDIKGQLDKPNLHRLIELYEHTVPAFGHVREFMELVFESAHQPLKRCIARSNNHDAHIFAVEHCAGNDCQGRIAALLRKTSHEDEKTKTAATRGIRRLILGERADLLDEEKHCDLIRDIDKTVHRLFTPALRKQFEKDTLISNFCIPKRSMWRARERIEVKNLCDYLAISEPELGKVIDLSKRWIEALYPDIPESGEAPLGQGNHVLRLFRKGRRIKVEENGRQVGRPSGYDTISANTCIQVYLDPSKLANKVLTSTPWVAGARPIFFAVLAVLQRKGETPFALCFKCTRKKDTIRRDVSMDDKSFQVLRLTPDIRRVALYHICDEDKEGNVSCEWDSHMEKVDHTKCLLSGGHFYFQTRVHGYPPRIA